jgi:glycosyltransferase involved in cell wall biosynthesis
MNENVSAINQFSDRENSMQNKTLLVITPDFPDEKNQYIGSIFVKNQLNSLKSYFKKIIVIAPVFFSGGLLPNDKYCKNYSYDNISVYYPRCFFFPRSVFIPLVKNANKLFFDTRLSAVKKLIEREDIKFDLIHAHFTWPSTYIAVRLKEQYHVPVVATIHEDSGWLNEEIGMNNIHIQCAWRNSDALIRVNRKEIPLLKKMNPLVFFVPNGFPVQYQPLDQKECRSRLQITKEKKVIFCLGDLIGRKGFSYLIDAMCILHEKYPDVLCYIGGKGPEEKNLLSQIHEKKMDHSITLLGFIPDPAIPLWMNSADLFVLPSLQESFGVVQIEALACGKPVIAARNVGSMEIIVSEDIGLLCEPADPASLANAIERGLTKQWNIQKILEYSKEYSWELVIKSMLPIYAHVLRDEKNP